MAKHTKKDFNNYADCKHCGQPELCNLENVCFTCSARLKDSAWKREWYQRKKLALSERPK